MKYPDSGTWRRELNNKSLLSRSLAIFLKLFWSFLSTRIHPGEHPRSRSAFRRSVFLSVLHIPWCPFWWYLHRSGPFPYRIPEPLVDGDHPNIGAVGLTFEVTYILDLVPVDVNPVVVEFHQPVKIFSDLKNRQRPVLKRRNTDLTVFHEEFNSSFDDPLWFRPGCALIAYDADILAEVPHLFQCEAVDGLFRCGEIFSSLFCAKSLMSGIKDR